MDYLQQPCWLVTLLALLASCCCLSNLLMQRQFHWIYLNSSPRCVLYGAHRLGSASLVWNLSRFSHWGSNMREIRRWEWAMQIWIGLLTMKQFGAFITSVQELIRVPRYINTDSIICIWIGRTFSVQHPRNSKRRNNGILAGCSHKLTFSLLKWYISKTTCGHHADPRCSSST